MFKYDGDGVVFEALGVHPGCCVVVLEHDGDGSASGFEVSPGVEHAAVDDIGKGGLWVVCDVFLQSFLFEAASVEVTLPPHEGDAGSRASKRVSAVLVPESVCWKGFEVESLEVGDDVDGDSGFV